MKRQLTHVVVATCLLELVHADRFAVDDDGPAYEYESTPTNSPTSRSLQKSLGFIVSWLLAILVLRLLVLLAGKVVVWCSELFDRWKGYMATATSKPGRRKVKRRGSNASLFSLGSLSDILRYDDGASYSTGESFNTDGTMSDDSYDDDSTSYQSKSSSLMSSVFMRFKKGKSEGRKRFSGQTDEEEGSFISKYDASTIASVRSRFTNGGNSHCATVNNTVNNVNSRQPSNKGVVRNSKSKYEYTKDAYTDARAKEPSKLRHSNVTDKRDRVQHVQQKPDVGKESPPKRKNSKEKQLSNYLEKREPSNRRGCATVDTGSRMSMDEVDLYSVVPC